jgi:hypothetical protein
LRQPNGTFQAGHVGEQRVLADLDAVHDDLAGDRRREAELAADLRGREALHALLQHEAADLVVVRGRLRPHHEHVAMGEFEIHILEPEMR